MFDLIERNGVSPANIDPPSFFKRATPVDSNEVAVFVEQRATGIAWVDGGICLDAIGIFKERASWVLVAMNSGNDSIGYGWIEVSGQKKGVADRKAPVAHANFVTVLQRCYRKIIPSKKFDQGNITDRINAHQDGIVEFSIVDCTFHGSASRLHNVVVA